MQIRKDEVVDITTPSSYNSYGFSITSGVGVSAVPTYTWIFK
ncbi:hypothetical protein TRIP_D250069 [uncultured Paludibacter sp.]|nr:hypothetical protein TRIP_D250069 [uncultured Paludibacter sp.]